MTTFQVLLLCGIIIAQASISILHSRQIYKLTEEICQVYARIALLELEASDNG